MCECNGHRAAIVITLLLLDSFSYDSEHRTLNKISGYRPLCLFVDSVV